MSAAAVAEPTEVPKVEEDVKMPDGPTTETETEDQKKQRAVRQGASNSQYHHPPLPIPSCHDRGLEARDEDNGPDFARWGVVCFQSSFTLQTRTCRLTSVYMRPNVDPTAER